MLERIPIGINNVFDHDPPHSVDNFPRPIYDPTGRFVYASVTKKFWAKANPLPPRLRRTGEREF